MSDYTKFSIRVSDQTKIVVENFARVHGMSRNAAVEFLLKLGVDFFQKGFQIEGSFDKLENQLRLVYQSLVKQGLFISLSLPQDQQAIKKSGELAEAAVQKIFDQGD